MTTLTDPARELAEICTQLSITTSETGLLVLAREFGVDSFSAEFYQILFTIQSRIDELVEIVATIEMDDDYQQEAIQHIQQIRHAFSQNGIGNQWNHSVGSYISPAQLGPLKMLSTMVRSKYSYPKLTDEEQADLLTEIDQLLEWLGEQQLYEHDFIRATLIDGVKQFRFRLARLKWVGWGYATQSLREVIGAYLALEVGMPDPSVSPDIVAVMAKVRAMINKVYQKAGLVKDVLELAGFGLKAYGAIALSKSAPEAITALLT
jgi:hypothetical protein